MNAPPLSYFFQLDMPQLLGSFYVWLVYTLRSLGGDIHQNAAWRFLPGTWSLIDVIHAMCWLQTWCISSFNIFLVLGHVSEYSLGRMQVPQVPQV